jgi:flagellar basal body P-ring protein FlgI
VAVPIFTNRDFVRNVEFDLTKAVIEQIESHTPYKVVPRERADTILEGEIVAIESTPISHSSDTATPQEQLLAVTVNFIWKDLRSGRILVQRRDFETAAAYYPTLGEGQFVGKQQAVEKLATAIVQELQADW